MTLTKNNADSPMALPRYISPRGGPQMLWDPLEKKLRYYLGIFPKWRTPHPFWEPLIQKKYRLFCILGP